MMAMPAPDPRPKRVPRQRTSGELPQEWTVKENLLEQRILDLCARLPLRTMLIKPAKVRGRFITPYAPFPKGRNGKGWLDFTAVGAGGALFRELKMDGKYPTPEQRLWIAAWRDIGYDADVWKVADWESGRIERELKAIARPRT